MVAILANKQIFNWAFQCLNLQPPKYITPPSAERITYNPHAQRNSQPYAWYNVNASGTAMHGIPVGIAFAS